MTYASFWIMPAIMRHLENNGQSIDDTLTGSEDIFVCDGISDYTRDFENGDVYGVIEKEKKSEI